MSPPASRAHTLSIPWRKTNAVQIPLSATLVNDRGKKKKNKKQKKASAHCRPRTNHFHLINIFCVHAVAVLKLQSVSKGLGHAANKRRGSQWKGTSLLIFGGNEFKEINQTGLRQPHDKPHTISFVETGSSWDALSVYFLLMTDKPPLGEKGEGVLFRYTLCEQPILSNLPKSSPLGAFQTKNGSVSRKLTKCGGCDAQIPSL